MTPIHKKKKILPYPQWFNTNIQKKKLQTLTKIKKPIAIYTNIHTKKQDYKMIQYKHIHKKLQTLPKFKKLIAIYTKIHTKKQDYSKILEIKEMGRLTKEI